MRRRPGRRYVSPTANIWFEGFLCCATPAWARQTLAAITRHLDERPEAKALVAPELEQAATAAIERKDEAAAKKALGVYHEAAKAALVRKGAA